MQNYPPPSSPQGAPNYSPSGMPPAATPKSKKPWIIGGIVGCLALVVMALAALGGLGYYVSRNLKSTQNGNAPAPVRAASTKQYVNTRGGRGGKLSDNFVDFSFYYPENWDEDADPAPNFVRVERKQVDADGAEFTQENFAVGWVSGTGTALDKGLMPKLAEQFNTQFSAQFPNYRKVSEGETTVGPYEGYEFRFTANQNNVDFWGRVVLLPPPTGQTKGAALVMIASDHSPDVTGVDDVGVKGELPVILDSFRFGAGSRKAAPQTTP